MANSTNVPQIPFGDTDGMFFGGVDNSVTAAPTEEYYVGYYDNRRIAIIYSTLFVVSSLILILKYYQYKKSKQEQENDQEVETPATNIQIPDGSAVASPTGKTIKHQTTLNTATTVNHSTSNTVGTSGNFPKSYAQTYDDAPKKKSRFFSPVGR